MTRMVMAAAAVISLSSFVGAQAIGAQTDAQKQYQLGRDAIVRGEPGKAVPFFDKAVELQPNRSDYHYQLANACELAAVDAGMFGAMPFAKRAKAELERAIQLDPNLIVARFALMEFHLQAPALLGGSQAAAVEQANEIRKRDAIDGYRAFARMDTAAKKPELARKEFDDMVKAEPKSARAHYYFGVYVMTTEKNYTAANAEFESVVKLDPNYQPGYFQIGHVASLAGNNFVRGEETLKRYLAYQPKDDEPSIARGWFWLGGIYEKQGKKSDAKLAYAASLKINPTQKDVDAALKRVS